MVKSWLSGKYKNWRTIRGCPNIPDSFQNQWNNLLIIIANNNWTRGTDNETTTMDTQVLWRVKS